MRRKVFFAPLGKSLNIIEEIEGLSLVDTSFAPRDSPRPAIFLWPCHRLPLVMGVTMILNIHSLTRCCERCLWGREIVFFFT